MPSLNFKGKALVQNHHLVVPFSELEAVKSAGLSKSPSLHDNLIIEGDNLKALKALLPIYHGKVKCIYIDPPYNTGNEGWIYNDKVNSPMIRDWLGKTVDRDDLTRHDKWCCMMLPRLKLLRELLTDDGAIFVSIDDNEVHHLRALMDEVFGEENLLAAFVRKRRLSTGMRGNPVSPDHEYIVCYARLFEKVALVGTKRKAEDYPFRDKVGLYRSTDLTIGMGKDLRPNQFYMIKNPTTLEEYWPADNRVWRFEPETMRKEIASENVIWPKGESRMTRPRYKTRFEPNEEKQNPVSTWIESELPTDDVEIESINAGLNQAATRELREILRQEAFAYPKPVSLVKEIVRIATDKTSIILDSFAGSGTTAHAVLALNKEDGGNRRFILCQMPFETKGHEDNQENICQTITAERVRRVIQGVAEAKDENLRKGLGGTFSYFRLGRELEKQAILDGKDLPGYEALAGYVFWTATGEEFQPKKVKRKQWFIGESREYDVFLIYDEKLETLKDMALTLDVAKALPDVSGKPKLVFAPTKYLDQDFLDRCRITFCQLPFEIYQAAETKS